MQQQKRGEIIFDCGKIQFGRKLRSSHEEYVLVNSGVQ